MVCVLDMFTPNSSEANSLLIVVDNTMGSTCTCRLGLKLNLTGAYYNFAHVS